MAGIEIKGIELTEEQAIEIAKQIQEEFGTYSNELTIEQTVNEMEIRVKAQVIYPHQIKEVVEIIREIEKEHSCNCTLLEVESTET